MKETGVALCDLLTMLFTNGVTGLDPAHYVAAMKEPGMSENASMVFAIIEAPSDSPDQLFLYQDGYRYVSDAFFYAPPPTGGSRITVLLTGIEPDRTA